MDIQTPQTAVLKHPIFNSAAASADDGERMEATSTDDEQSDNAWSKDSDNSDGGDL